MALIIANVVGYPRVLKDIPNRIELANTVKDLKIRLSVPIQYTATVNGAVRPDTFELGTGDYVCMMGPFNGKPASFFTYYQD